MNQAMLDEMLVAMYGDGLQSAKQSMDPAVMHQYAENHLKLYFGDSHGETIEEYARNSSKLYVRSQDHLGEDSPEATGKRMTAYQVYKIFGLEVMGELFEYCLAIIVRCKSEPAGTLVRRREKLGLTQTQVAEMSGVTLKQVIDAEDNRSRTSIHILEKIANALGLDPLKISWVPDALKE